MRSGTDFAGAPSLARDAGFTLCGGTGGGKGSIEDAVETPVSE